jgi:hypothetical protein
VTGLEKNGFKSQGCLVGMFPILKLLNSFPGQST